MILYNISIWITRIFHVILIILGLIYTFKKYNPRVLRSFWLYALSFSVLDILLQLYPQHTKQFLIADLMFELIYLTYLFLSFIPNRKVGYAAWAGNFLICLFIILNFNKIDIAVTVWGNIFESVVLCPLCVIIIVGFFNRENSSEIRNEPAFWIALGGLFGFVLQVPTYLIAGYFMTALTREYALGIFAIFNLVQTITYIMFIKALLCRIKIF